MHVVETLLSHRSRLALFTSAIALTSVTLTGCTGASTSLEHRSDTYTGELSTLVLDFDDSGAKQIGVTTASLSAQIVGADRDDIEVRRTLEFTDGDKPAEVIDHDTTGLAITGRCPDRWAVGNPTCVARYEIAVPFGTVVQANSKFGDLTVTDTRAAVDLNSRYGDVTLVAGPGSYAVDAVSATGANTIEVRQDPAGIPVRLRSDDGSVIATADTR
jgi:hypothetical protein